MNEETIYFGKDLEAMSSAVNYTRWILEHFQPFLGKNVAEVGAGTGNFSRYLVDCGVERLLAFEPSDNMYPILAQRFAGNSKIVTSKAYFDGGQHRNAFDSILYVNVLEHIEDDVAAMQGAHQALAPGGHILVFVPALQFLYSELDRQVGHFRRYSKKELVRVVSAAGFTIRKVRYFDLAGIIPWYIAFVLLKQTATSGNVSLYDKLVVPLMKRVEKIVPPCTGKNLLLVGKKEENVPK